MNFYDKILKLIEKNNGYVTTKEVVENGINKIFLTNMVRNGKLVRMRFSNTDKTADDCLTNVLKNLYR